MDPSLVRFRAVVEGALAALEARRQEINDLNVFPVADGDTGDNMALTLRAVVDELARLGDQDMPLDEIGRVFGVTRERIRQIEAKTMTKLRHPARSQTLRGYVD